MRPSVLLSRHYLIHKTRATLAFADEAVEKINEETAKASET